jgi:PAS domain S-box-containing protein
VPSPQPPSEPGAPLSAPRTSTLSPLQRQTLLADASLLLASAPSLEVGLEHLVRRGVMDAVDWCALDLLTPEGAELHRAALAGPPGAAPEGLALLAEQALPLAHAPLVERVMRSGRAELLPPGEDGVPHALAATPAQREVLRHVPLTAILCAPLVARGRAWGVLWLACERGSGRRLGPEDLEFTESLAQRAALAVDQATRQRQVRREVGLTRTLLEHAPVGMAVLDQGLRFVHLNHALGAWLGVEPREAMGRPVHSLLPGLLDATRQVLATGRPELDLPLPLPSLEGPLAAPEAHCALYPLPGEDGAPAAVGLVVSAIPTLAPSPDAERLRLLARATNDVIWDWDLRTNRLEWNSALHTVFGYPEDAAHADLAWWEEHVHPEDRERAARTLHEAVEQALDCWTCEYRFRRADGSYAVVLDRGHVGCDDAGRPVRMIGSMLDITERTRRDQEREALVGALERERQQLRAVLEQLPLGVLIAEAPSGRVVLGNHRLEEILGGPLSLALDVAHDGDSGCFHPDGRPYAPEELPLTRAVVHGERVIAQAVDVRRRDGTRVPTRMFALPLHDASGARFGAVATVEDVSGRGLESEQSQRLARAEAARAEAEERLAWMEVLSSEHEAHQRWLEAVLDRAPFPLLLLEPETARVRFANRATERYGGGQELVVGTMDAARAPDPCPEYAAAQVPFDQLPVVRAARGEPLHGVLLHWSHGGRVRTLLAHSARCESAYGRPPSVMLAFQDVTALMRAEARLNRAVQARDAFLAVAAHELRTPLTAMKIAMGQLALDGRKLGEASGAGPGFARRLEATERQVRRMERLIHQLFDVTQLDAGAMRLTPTVVDLTQLVHEAAARFAEDAQRAGCLLMVRAETPVPGWWDRARLEQVLDNLLSNALRFGAGQPVTVAVAVQDGAASLTVVDHGIGIPAEAQSRIFERFERAVSERHYGGLGLGLWVTREILRAHHGNISVHSAPGAGARFIVTLPRAALPGAPGQ